MTPPDRDPSTGSPAIFLVLVLVLSIPFYLLGAEGGWLPGLAILPASALMAFVPMTAALILICRQDGRAGGVALLRRAFDFGRPGNAGWFMVAFLFMPAVCVLEFLVLRVTGAGPPVPDIGLDQALFFFLAFFIAAIGEELGWQGYLYPALRTRQNALGSALVVGVLWALWHVIPFVQLGRSLDWIVWHSLSAVALRVIIVWLFENTAGSIFGAVLFHTMINVSWALFPNAGSYYDPFITVLILAPIAGMAVLQAGGSLSNMLRPDQGQADGKPATRQAGTTRPFTGPGGAPLPNSIAEVRYLRLGGFDQWVMIRGESLDNPPVMLLHGGPGFSETPFFRRYNALLEKGFTVVYWDQRGAGKSFDPEMPKSAMTVERFITDLDELVDIVCARVGQSRVVIFGHSWGSALGPLYAARFPEKVSAYVGSGQIGDWQAGELASYAWTLAEAQRRGDSRALKQLRAIGPPPHDVSSLWKERAWLQRLTGQTSAKAWWDMSRTLFGGPESSVFDVLKFPSVLRGFRFSLDAMWAEVSALNLLTLAPSLQMPVFFFLGRRDHWVPPEVSVAYFERLTAPSKELLWFEDSGHEPFVDEPTRFNQLMLELVRPSAAVSGVNGRAALPPPG